MKRRFDIVIAGAGMVGLTIAALIARSEFAGNLSVTIIDAGDEPEFDENSDVDLRVSALSPGSAATLTSAGAWESIRSTRSCAFGAMRVWDSKGTFDGPETLRFDAADFALPQLGHIVENELIRYRLLQQIAASGTSIQFNTPLRRLLAVGERFVLETDGGPSLRPELVIAADGGNSFVREQAGLQTRSWRYGQTALVTHLRTERHHAQTAWQRFLPSGPLAFLPLEDGRVSIVWSTSDQEARDALAASGDELAQLLDDASDGVLGKLTPDGPRAVFPLHARYARNYAVPGLVLVGDAAHSVHPLAGQGVNLGLADAAQLVSAIGTALGNGEYPGDLPALRRYERARKGENQVMLRFIDGIARLFASEVEPLERLRGTGMRLFNRSGPVRRLAIEQALGLRR